MLTVSGDHKEPDRNKVRISTGTVRGSEGNLGRVFFEECFLVLM
jgi:hypothetical protein